MEWSEIGFGKKLDFLKIVSTFMFFLNPIEF